MGPQSLVPVTQATIQKYFSAGGPPTYYSKIGRELWLSPNATPDLTVVYWGEPDEISVSGLQTNTVLTEYPFVYLYRVLAELCEISQDGELVEAYMAAFADRVAAINNTAAFGAKGAGYGRSRG
jgi:hypothetical protein